MWLGGSFFFDCLAKVLCCYEPQLPNKRAAFQRENETIQFLSYYLPQGSEVLFNKDKTKSYYFMGGIQNLRGIDNVL